MKIENHRDINENSHYHGLLEMSFSCYKRYDQFINWLRTEYYFLQQENDSYLTIYFPNGHVKVEKEDENKNSFLSKITVESKCKKIGLKMKKNLSEFLEYVESYNKLSKLEY